MVQIKKCGSKKSSIPTQKKKNDFSIRLLNFM